MTMTDELTSSTDAVEAVREPMEAVALDDQEHDAADADDEPTPQVELTQTDHLNRKLLSSFLDSIKGTSANGTLLSGGSGHFAAYAYIPVAARLAGQVRQGAGSRGRGGRAQLRL